MTDFKENYNRYLTAFENALGEYIGAFSFSPQSLTDSMRYSLTVGGKRIRPVLLLSTAEMLGLKEDDVMNFAIAVEMIHTYSLIHDDLPAMDNDDFRRGKPSNHKVFGEAGAILAGDALLNEAYTLCLRESKKGEKYALAGEYLSECAGAAGMIAGQVADLENEKKTEFTEADLDFIYRHKTGKLLTAPVAMASIIADSRSFFELEKFGYEFGRLFQMTDDILDVTGDFKNLGKSIGKDKEEDKLTCVKVYGLDEAMIQADLSADKCRCLLDGVDGDASFLYSLVNFVRERNK